MIDSIAKLKQAPPGLCLILTRQQIDELGGAKAALVKLADVLDFPHIWLHDPETGNIVIGRAADENWRETMMLLEAKAQADWHAKQDGVDSKRLGLFRHEILMWLTKATPSEILHVRTLLQ